MNFATVKSLTIPEGKVVKIAKGDVVLWQAEPETEPIVNLIDAVGYTDSTRLSTSSGSLREQSGYVTTGLIQLDSVGDVYRTSGVNFKDANSMAGIWIYRKDESYWTYVHTTSAGSYDCKFGTAVLDDDGNLTVTVTSLGNSTGYFKLGGIGSGANLIVTKNQEIN